MTVAISIDRYIVVCYPFYACEREPTNQNNAKWPQRLKWLCCEVSNIFTQFITMIAIKKKIWGTSDMNFRAYTYVEYHIERQFQNFTREF